MALSQSNFRLNQRSDDWHVRWYLPHRDTAGLVQFVTFRLNDSVPAGLIDQWKRELGWREGLDSSNAVCAALRRRIEVYEDVGRGACYLRVPEVIRVVREALEKFDAERYGLLEWCIMPNHVHVMFEVIHGHPIEKVLQSWKSYTAKEANKVLKRSGTFWMRDYFDRFIRDEKHFEATIAYIHSQGPSCVTKSVRRDGEV
jgi:putative transposase